MSNLPKGIIAEKNGGLSFGDYTVSNKIKVNDFEYMGNIYSLRSHDLVTRFEKNGEMLIETVPGASVYDFVMDEKGCSFEIESSAGVQVTLGLVPDASYDLSIRGNKGSDIREEISVNRSGKLSFGIELGSDKKKVELRAL